MFCSRVLGCFAGLLALTLVTSCTTPAHLAVFDTGSSVELRSYQSRAFDTTDRTQTLRAVVATLQDLGFVIDKSDANLGTISGTKLAGYELRMSVTVRARNASQLLVRANAQYKPNPKSAPRPVEEPDVYREFFFALQKSLFLDAHEVT